MSRENAIFFDKKAKKTKKAYGFAKGKGDKMRDTVNFEQGAIQAAQDFLCGYQFCLDMLDLRKYERKRLGCDDSDGVCETLMAADEADLRARMYGISATLNRMRDGREKLILYYRYIKGMSVERASALLGVSRRTGYRLHTKGLQTVARMLEKA